MANTYVTGTPSGTIFDDTSNGTGMIPRGWIADDVAAGILVAASDNASDTIILTMNGVATGALPGTLIDTPFGANAIETLRVGDLVTVVEDGRRSSRPVRRVGRGRIDTARAADPVAAFPVRIRRDALADNVPSRDLLVTSEHRIHVAGRLIPARMLVNGASIVSDTTTTNGSFVYLELDWHAILLTEGLETESALDTDSRRKVEVDTRGRQASDGAAPCVDRAMVEPIRAGLARRAERLGLGTPVSASLTSAPALHLRTAEGATIAPVLCDGTVYAFVVPEGATGLRLVGRGFEFGRLAAPFRNDRRALGIGSLGMANIDGGVSSILHLVDSALPGWHAPEQDEADCWIGDDAVLPTGTESGPMVLVVDVPAARPFHTCGNA